MLLLPTIPCLLCSDNDDTWLLIFVIILNLQLNINSFFISTSQKLNCFEAINMAWLKHRHFFFPDQFVKDTWKYLPASVAKHIFSFMNALFLGGGGGEGRRVRLTYFRSIFCQVWRVVLAHGGRINQLSVFHIIIKCGAVRPSLSTSAPCPWRLWPSSTSRVGTRVLI